MKSYEEKADDALRRIKEERAVRKKKLERTAVIIPLTGIFIVAGAVALFNFQRTAPSSAVAGTSQGGETPFEDSSVVLGEKEKYSVYTDRVQLPQDSQHFADDMIPALVYKGSVYTGSGDFYPYDSALGELVGEYVGEAKGTLDEWSTQDDWAEEFASSVKGSVYTVNGYSQDFRLVVCFESGGVQLLHLLDNYDGIGLNTGADIFESRLHINGNIESVTYKPHADWDAETGVERELTEVTEEDFSKFLNELCLSPFERIEYDKNPGFYSTETQGHLYLHMKDGTVNELRLIEGGYVGCQDLPWIFVKMPGEIFDRVLSSCQ